MQPIWYHLDVVLRNLGDMGSSEFSNIFQEGYASLNDDLLVPIWCYVGDQGLEVIFDSGCTIAVTSVKKDFVWDIQPVSKMMQDLGSTAEVAGKGTTQWNFRDNYGVNQVVQVEIYIVTTNIVRLFSHQPYFKKNK